MNWSRKISKARLEVYSLAVAGNCQKSISQQLDKSKGTISEHINGLLENEYIIEISGGDKVKFYERGPNSKALDTALIKDSSENKRAERSTTHVKDQTNSKFTEPKTRTPNYAELPPTCEVHSHGVRAMVKKLGDLDTWMVDKTGGLKGLYQHTGDIKLKDGRTFTVRYQESKKTGIGHLYATVQAELTAEEMNGDIEATLMSYAQDAFNEISRKHGWKFGLMESYKGSKTHFVVNSELTNELSQALPEGLNIETEKMHTDNSPPRPDGKPTAETKDKQTAINLMTSLPELLEANGDLKVAIQIMNRNQTLILRDEMVTKEILNNVIINQRMIMKALGIKDEIKPETDNPQPLDSQQEPKEPTPEPGTGTEAAG